MKRKKTVAAAHIPDAELEVMQTLWQSKGSMLVADIAKEIEKKHKCTKSSVHILCDRLSKRGFVSIELVDDGPVAFKKISPVLSEQEYRASEADEIVTKVFRGSWKNLVASLIDAGKIGESDLEELTAIVNGKGKKK